MTMIAAEDDELAWSSIEEILDCFTAVYLHDGWHAAFEFFVTWHHASTAREDKTGNLALVNGSMVSLLRESAPGAGPPPWAQIAESWRLSRDLGDEGFFDCAVAISAAAVARCAPAQLGKHLSHMGELAHDWLLERPEDTEALLDYQYAVREKLSDLGCVFE